MKTALRVFVGVGLSLLLLVAAALLAALQPEPSVAQQPAPTQHDVARTMNLLRLHDPRRALAGRVSAAQVSERDIDVLLNHAARRWLEAHSRVQFQSGMAVLQASVHLPPNPFGRWANLEARFTQTDGLPALASVQLGRLPVPRWLAQRMLLLAAQRAGVQGELELAASVIQRVRFMPEQAQIVYAWQDDSAQRMLGALLPPDERVRLRAYRERLVELAALQTQADARAPLVALLGPMFELARERTAAGGDAAAENRAALSTLTLFASGRDIGRLVPDAADWPQPRPLRLTLAGRDDFPLHFLVSAALAAEGTGPLSKAIGIYKEVMDSRIGSGFSFNDMAANRAGARIGEMAVARPQQLQARLARGVQESDFMPPWADLPEFMPEADFRRRFGGIDAPAYQAMMAEIERRVDALPLLR